MFLFLVLGQKIAYYTCSFIFGFFCYYVFQHILEIDPGRVMGTCPNHSHRCAWTCRVLFTGLLVGMWFPVV